MGDALKKVQPGDTLAIPAEAYNAFIDAARDYQQRTRHVGQQATPGYRSAGIILVRNDSGSDLPRWAAAVINGIAINPADNEQVFCETPCPTIAMPTTANQLATTGRGRMVILQEPIAAGAIGRARASGLTVAKINLSNPKHRFVTLWPGSTYAVSGYPRQVFFPLAGGDEDWAKLARNLKAEIDAEKIKAYSGAVAFRSKEKAVAFEKYLKSHSGRAFAKKHF